MSHFKEFGKFDGIGLAELVRKKEVSPSELCEEAISRVEQVNPRLNAVVTPMYDIARKAVQEPLPEGPFKGVPFLLKDLIDEFAGVTLSMGSRAYRNYIPSRDSEIVTRFKRAGLVILGKTNTPEFGLLGITEPELHGPARNPWHPEHTPGGSSGGAAGAVASGMVPMASCDDGGGSIRIPASCCGLFGLKPTRGRNPMGPEVRELWQGAVVSHVITRSVRDSAAMLDATQGSDSFIPYVIPASKRPYLQEIERDPGPLRIAFSAASPIDTPVHGECVQAVEETARLLESLGHKVEEAHPDVDGKQIAKNYFTLYFGETAADIEALKSELGRQPKPSDVEALTWTIGLLGRAFSAGEFVSARRWWDLAAGVMDRFHEKYDLYLTPTMAHPPVKIGELQPTPYERIAMKVVNALRLGRLLKASGLTDRMAETSLSKTPFTQLANLTGQPAMSVPLHWTSDGLPIGVHFMAPFGDEITLFRLGAQLERERPWFDKHAEIWSG